MLHILIDGYNLIGTAHKDLKKARSDIVEKLLNYSNLKGHNITIVFDGWKDGQIEETRMHIGNVTIIYSRLGEKADFVIEKLLSKTIKSWIVVSSDREISGFANKKRFVSITSDEFEDKLYSVLKVRDIDRIEIFSEENEDETFPAHRRGNPRKLSKMQKRKFHALKKL